MALSSIRILDDLTINQISAGEVVDRPISVVRELVENSIDAQATKIIVELIDAGKKLIRVVDNGIGMSRDDALLAIERHATSKITKPSDLNQITTLGFRGEALPSIASVSKMHVKTKTLDQQSGTLLSLSGGRLISVKDVACNSGTTIEIERLFFNTPARKKFLKSNKTEESKIKHWLQSISIANPEVAIQLYLDEKINLSLPSSINTLERVERVFPDSKIKVSSNFQNIKISGYLSTPSLSLSDASGLMIIVNGRLVSDRLILKAIKEAFGIALKHREFPKGCLLLNLPPSQVDVNVHPQKTEVRFQNPQIIFDQIQTAIKFALKDYSLPNNFGSTIVNQSIPDFNYEKVANAPISFEFQAKQNFTARSEQEFQTKTRLSDHSTFSVSNDSNISPQSEYPTPFRYSDLKYIGQALGCYLICEHQQDLYLVDLHAAHERFNFNLTKNNFLKRNKNTQVLLLPITISLNVDQQAFLIEQEQNLNNLGFRIAPLGENSIIIYEIPTILKDKDLVTLVKELAVNDEDLNTNNSFENYIDYACARIACHASKRSGDVLSKAGVYALFASLDSSELAGACPHGRPTMIKLTKYQIEKSFGR